MSNPYSYPPPGGGNSNDPNNNPYTYNPNYGAGVPPQQQQQQPPSASMGGGMPSQQYAPQHVPPQQQHQHPHQQAYSAPPPQQQHQQQHSQHYGNAMGGPPLHHPYQQPPPPPQQHQQQQQHQPPQGPTHQSYAPSPGPVIAPPLQQHPSSSHPMVGTTAGTGGGGLSSPAGSPTIRSVAPRGSLTGSSSLTSIAGATATSDHSVATRATTPRGGGGGESAVDAAEPATPSGASEDKNKVGDDKNKDDATVASSGKIPSAENKAPIPTDQAVLEYLKRKGMGSAVLELTNMLKQKEKEQEDQEKSKSAEAQDDKDEIKKEGDEKKSDEKKGDDEKKKSIRERLEEEDEINRYQRSLLTKSTGGGYGYDRDAAWPILQWGVPDAGRRLPDGNTTTATPHEGGGPLSDSTQIGVEEARAYLDAFCSVQIWVLSMPDEHSGMIQTFDNPLVRAQALLKQAQQGTVGASITGSTASLQAVIKELTSKQPQAKPLSGRHHHYLPPSAKAELLAVTFALLVHTYCELLEVGMESTAHVLRNAFEPVYAALYPSEYRDLFQCTTTDDMMRLNAHNSQHMEALANLKSILVQVASYQLRREELHAQTTMNTASDPNLAAKNQKIAEYDRNINILKSKYNEMSQRASQAFARMHDLPFLRRARAVRWQLTMSTMTYGLLCSFLNTSKDDSLLAMSTLLQTKCVLHVERRDPLPFTPACVLDESDGGAEGDDIMRLDLNKMEISWAVPSIKTRLTSKDEKLPFPKFHLDDEYDDEAKAAWDKKMVEFNRNLLINGFRRLEAIERKQEYEVLPASHKRAIAEAIDHPNNPLGHTKRMAADPLEASILLTTLCADSLNSGGTAVSDAAAIWEEPGIGICCAKMSPPDGRLVAAGCDDSAIRVWNIMDSKNGELSQVLLGHKNGFPVFDVDWNRDGRTLLSGGGDGTVRLWDAVAVGPFGEVAPPPKETPSSKFSSSSGNKKNTATTLPPTQPTSKVPDMSVPDLKPELGAYRSGAALAVYRGHAPSAPVWSVAFAPSGYYFASAGADATARLWTTDRNVPVRLFVGHTARNVNCVAWHPNCNYIVTGSDDKTVRLWDIQNGRTVRLLNGCSAGINVVKVCPSGRYVAGADYGGTVHIWELGTGKKVTEFRPLHNEQNQALVHSMCFSACGSALATGGDDCCVRIWDVRNHTLENHSPVCNIPHKSFATRRTTLLDLQYTKRNLLLSVGKFISPLITTLPE